MNRVERSEILPLGEYEKIRPHFRKRVIEQKRVRRVKLGEHMSVVFENHDTVLLQIQEMLRTERITKESGIAHEIETYNELVPGDRQLSLTLFVEIADKELRERKLVEWEGLERHVSVEIDGEQAAAAGERQGVEAGRTTAVHYLKVQLSPEQATRVAGKAAKLALRVDLPSYQARCELPAALAAELADDLS